MRTPDAKIVAGAAAAVISGFLNEQCVLLYADSYRLAPGYYGANAAINCTR
ncbi:hypothetical protein [Streptomyces roseifaciens]|uniref:hypothetical protein n=1 Tax=Streptomyces roseifaciens TaxID=1488406 RepID=UPI000A444379|nr:hypothetical protein [Streptomyces roseifaciens]